MDDPEDDEDDEDGDDQEDNEDDEDDGDDGCLGGAAQHRCPFKFVRLIIPFTEFSPTVQLVAILFNAQSLHCQEFVNGLETQPLGPIACCFK